MIHKTQTIVGKLTLALALSAIGTQAMAAGALAIDSNQGRQYGFAYNYPNMGQAEQQVLNECGYGCQVVVRFNTGCAAYAADQARGSTAYGWGTSSSGGEAQNIALSGCQSRGGTSCLVRAWGCNSR